MQNDMKRMIRHAVGAMVVVSVLATAPALAEVAIAPPDPSLGVKEETFRATKAANRKWPRRMEKERPVRAPSVAAVERPPVVVPYLEQLRKRMVAGETLSTPELRDLADSGDSLAAMKFATRLEALDNPAVLPDAVHYYSMAVYLGRDYGRSRLVALMGSRDVVLSPSRLEAAQQALARLSDKGDADAALALAQMYTQGWPFAADPAAAQHWLQAAADNGSTEAVQKMAMAALLPRDGLAADPAAVRAALDLLATSGDPGKIAIAQNLQAQLDAAAAAEPKDITQ